MSAMIERWVRPAEGPQTLGAAVVDREPSGQLVEATRPSRHDGAQPAYSRRVVPINPSPGLGRLWRLAIAIGVLALVTLGCGTTTAPTCEGSERLRFGDGSAVPLCDLRMSIGAVAGRPSLDVSGRLPARGPYGAGQELATFAVIVYRFDGPGEYVAGGSVNVNPHRTGIFGAVDMAPDWSGTCGIDARADGLGIDCDLRGNADDELNVTAELPSAPDPRRDVGLRWLDETYAFEGDYVAAATLEAAMDVHDDGRVISVPLADGGLLTIMPEGRDPDGRVWDLALPAQSPATTQLGIPEWREEVPSLGACVVTRSADPFQGSMHCPGDPASMTGSATLEMSWRVAR